VRTSITAVVLAVVTAAVATGCQKPDPHGTVVGRLGPIGSRGPRLLIRVSTGERVDLTVGWPTWKRCRVHARYSASKGSAW
jgi:hypothetical protein